jgi:hypothetical protein
MIIKIGCEYLSCTKKYLQFNIALLTLAQNFECRMNVLKFLVFGSTF